MKGFKIRTAIGILTFVLMCGTAWAAGIEVAIGAWNQAPDGDISYKPLSAQDSLSLKDNLKFSSTTKVFGRMKIEAPFIPSIYLMATPMEFSASGSKNSTFQFGNIKFIASAPFKSKLRLDHYDIGLCYGIPGLKLATAGVLNFDLGLDARIIDFKAQITGQETIGGTTITESKALTVPVPMLYLGLQVSPVKWLAVEGEFRGVIYSGNHYYDCIGRAKVKPVGPVFVAAGYRYEKADIDISDVKADVSFGGLFGEVGFAF
ncbi:MAG TPA: TIGR04219 family outer membrane beta-barrel protein [Desulfomonilia bacterium]|nr:TIGR04219 family outer membrane beta-barrel protein [Desulfomonilia bacterium]